VSERRPTSGWNAVDVSRNAVVSQDALFDEWKYDVMTGCDDAMIVLSKFAMKYVSMMPAKTTRNCRGCVLTRKLGGSLSS
jgi:hypothetical protein